MTEHVYKVVEIVGSSEESVTKAIDRAIAKASETLRQLGWFEVIQVRGHIQDGKVAQYQVTLKVGFRLEDS
jgi:flavin-binding protein dodecin